MDWTLCKRDVSEMLKLRMADGPALKNRTEYTRAVLGKSIPRWRGMLQLVCRVGVLSSQIQLVAR
jgi:hypothetical protein